MNLLILPENSLLDFVMRTEFFIIWAIRETFGSECVRKYLDACVKIAEERKKEYGFGFETGLYPFLWQKIKEKIPDCEVKVNQEIDNAQWDICVLFHNISFNLEVKVVWNWSFATWTNDIKKLILTAEKSNARRFESYYFLAVLGVRGKRELPDSLEWEDIRREILENFESKRDKKNKKILTEENKKFLTEVFPSKFVIKEYFKVNKKLAVLLLKLWSVELMLKNVLKFWLQEDGEAFLFGSRSWTSAGFDWDIAVRRCKNFSKCYLDLSEIATVDLVDADRINPEFLKNAKKLVDKIASKREEQVVKEIDEKEIDKNIKMEKKEIEVKERKFALALSTLQEALGRLKEKPDDRIVKDSVIKRFEYTFETGWRYLRAICIAEGIIPKTPRDTITKAYEIGRISAQERETWLEMLEVGNLTSHTYDEKLADEVVEKIKNKFFEAFQKTLQKR